MITADPPTATDSVATSAYVDPGVNPVTFIINDLKPGYEMSAAVNFSGNKITLTFNEYIEVKEAQTNILVSPFPKKNPEINYRLKTVTVKLKDTLQPNTTYSINFGKAIVDVNEGNPLGNFTYIFSTGAAIDSLQLTGTVQIAETGKVDSTLLILLYRNATDSTVQKTKPNLLTILNQNHQLKS